MKQLTVTQKIIAAATGITVIGGAVSIIWAWMVLPVRAMEWHDARYMLVSTGDQLLWSTWKEDIRQLRKDIRTEDNLVEKENLEDDLEELLDKYCMKFKDDTRTCGGTA